MEGYCRSKMDCSDDHYYWKKHSGPTPEKDFEHNRYVAYTLRDLKKDLTVAKTYHVSDGEGCWTEEEQNEYDNGVLRCDIAPYLRHSLNKKEAWNINEDISYDMLINLQSLHPDMDVVVLQRTCLNTSYWFGIPHYIATSVIKTFHQIENDVYVKKSTMGNGQPYSHFLASNRENSKKKEKKMDEEGMKQAKKTIVAYNIFKSPSNYAKILNNQYSSWGKCWNKKEWKQRKRGKYSCAKIVADLEYIPIDNDNDMDDDILIGYPSASQFYNFDDHLIDRFVFVKRRNRIASSVSSNWSDISI